jgi:monoamine oxidase
VSHCDVLVIGAGISGLAAAKALMSKGVSVQIIEARDRVGGRIHTVDGFDLGAHWIHGTEGNPLTNLAHQWGLPLYFVGGDSAYPGSWSRMHFPALPDQERDQSLIALDQVMDRLDATRDIFAPGSSIKAATDMIMADLALTPQQVESVRWHLNLLAREDCAGGPERLSAAAWDEGYEVYGTGDSICVGGFAMLINRLAGALDIRLNCPVSVIRHGPDGVIIETAQGEFRAAHAIVTLPVAVLKAGQVVFDPPLPVNKRQAFERIGIGALAKARLVFAKPFWPETAYGFGFVVGKGDRPTNAISNYAITGTPEIVTFYGGDLAREYELLDEASACAETLALLREEFGDHVPNPVGFTRTNWSNDPFAMGSYSYVAAGSSPADFATLAQPVGDTLGFAGEATSTNQWACAHGAYVSGLREAARITGDQALLPPRNFTENRRWRAQMARASRFFNLRIRALAEDEIASRTALLKASLPFAGIDHAELRLLATMFEMRSLTRDEWLCRTHDPADHVFLIENGTLDVIDDARSSIVATLSRGSLTGEYALFHDGRRTASIRATSDSVVLALDYQRFTRFLGAFPQASLALLRQIVGRQAGS